MSKDAPEFSREQWAEFEQRLSYFVDDPGETGFDLRLGAQLEQMRSAGSRNHLFCVSTPTSIAHP